ncbi:MAG: hypothetical protein ACP5U0_07860 [Caldisphaera sp.]
MGKKLELFGIKITIYKRIALFAWKDIILIYEKLLGYKKLTGKLNV